MQKQSNFTYEFLEKCAEIQPYSFIEFVSKTNSDGRSILNLVSDIQNNPIKNEKNIKLNKEIISKYVNEFYSKYLPQKAEEVKQILNKTHPFFMDSKNKSHVKFKKVQKGDCQSSSVSHSGTNSFLEFNVFLHNSIDDLRTTAHEVAHALSSHHQHLIKLIRSNASKEEIDNYTKKDFGRDCIGEIESYIIERLFNRFLVFKGLYSKEDLKNYENIEKSSLMSETNTIKEETAIFKQLPCPVTKESFEKFYADLKSKNDRRLLDRVNKIHNNGITSSYMFRYIVGRVVADQWIKKFDEAEMNEKRKMLNDFQNYLDTTHELKLNQACEQLLGNKFSLIVDDYVTDKINENSQISGKNLP